MTTQEIFTTNLNRLLQDHSKSQRDLAGYVGVSANAVSKWTKGYSTPRMDKIDLICSFFQVNRSDLLQSRSATGHANAVRIPVLGRVAAGVPLDAVEDVIDWEEIPAEMARSGEYFCLQLHGDSMEPRMKEGDVVVVRKQPDVESGSIAIVRVNGNDATCKRVTKSAEGITLSGLNPDFAPIFYSKSDIEKLPVEIAGKVVELRAKF